MEVTILAILAHTITVVEVFASNLGHLELESFRELLFAIRILREAVTRDEEVRGSLTHGTLCP
jgi:hypothetical protein